jgi:hypothetical protein
MVDASSQNCESAVCQPNPPRSSIRASSTAAIMAIERFGSVSVFRPSHGIECDIREVARAHLHSKFTSGEYRGSKIVNAILQHQYRIYEALLQPLIPKLATRDGAEFLLSQYDEAWRLLHGNGILDLMERERLGLDRTENETRD